MLAAHALKGYEERCFAAASDGYNLKPIRTRELLYTIEKVMGKYSSGEPSGAMTTSDAARNGR